MTEPEVIDAAREAGCFPMTITSITPLVYPTRESIFRFAAIIETKTREKDALIASKYATGASHAIRGQE